MSRSTKTLASGKENLSRIDAAKKIRAIADKIESGELQLNGEKSVTAIIPQAVELEIEYKEKVKKSGLKKFEIELEIEWTEGTNNIAF